MSSDYCEHCEGRLVEIDHYGERLRVVLIAIAGKQQRRISPPWSQHGTLGSAYRLIR